ncbi:hypothetical protein MMC17_009916 [Xylographa soralifera]|nr:hypothetical protein [Xylographa soralifera]
MPQNRPPAQKSMKVAAREAMKGDAIPSDFGLLPGTFVMPSRLRRPSIIRSARLRLQLEWHRLKTRVIDFGGVIYYKWGIAKKPNPRPKLALRNTGRIAQALYTQMYTAFAEPRRESGDLALLRKTCSDGLFASFQSRIASRPKNQKLRWTLHQYTRTPRVVSHRAVVLPMVKGAALRQAIVTVHSRQSLTHLKAGEEMTSGTGEVKEVKEYVVVQRRMWKEHEEPWMVWGTTEESDWPSTSPD